MLRLTHRALILGVLLLGAALPTSTDSARGAASDALHVLRVSPGDATGEAPRATPVVVFFDRPVVPLTTIEATATAAAPARVAPATPGRGRWLNTATWAWYPAPALRGATRYTVTVPAGLRAVDGSTLAAPYTASFQTVRPAVAHASPGDGAAYADYRALVTVRFNQDVDRASAAASFALHDGAGHVVAGTFSWPRGDTLIFRPTGGLTLGARYNAVVTGGLRSAEGPLPASGQAAWSFTTAAQPDIAGTTPANGERSADMENGLTLRFTAPVDVARVRARLLLLPRPSNMSVSVSDDGLSVQVYGDWAPSTRYHVALGGVIGSYGQALAHPLRLGFISAPLPPAVQFAYSGPIVSFDAYRPVDVAVRGVNTRAVELALYPLSRDEFLSLPNANMQTFQPSTGAIFATRRALATPLNRPVVVAQELANTGGGLLRPGYYFLRAAGADGGADQIGFIVTRTALTFKASPGHALVWATDLHSGQSLPGLSLRITRVNGGRLVAAGRTGADGALDAHEISPAQPDMDQLAVTVDRPGDVALCTSNWNTGVSAYDYHLPASYGATTRQGYLYTDRPIYRPGGPVHYRGLARRDDDGAYGLLVAGTPVHITLTDGNGRAIYTNLAHLDSYGAFAGTLTLPSNAAIGVDTLDARIDGQDFTVQIQVAAYRKPDYTVVVNPSRGDANYTSGATVRATVAARYLFDAPLNRARVHWSVVAGDLYFSAPAYPDYTFQDYPDTFWYSSPFAGNLSHAGPRLPGYPVPAGGPAFGEEICADACGPTGGAPVVAQGDARTDGNGHLTLSIPANLRRASLSQQWSVEANVTDINSASVSGRVAVLVHKAQFYIGLRDAAPFTAAGQATHIDLLTIGQDAATLTPRIPLTLTLYRRTYRQVDDPSTPFPQERPVDTPLKTFSAATGAAGHGGIDLTLPSGGEYRLVATARDAMGNTARSALSLYAEGAGEASSPWLNAPQDRVRLIPDKALYRIGDEARILVAAPRPDMTALVTVERGRVYSHRVLRLSGSSPALRVPILPGYLPNVFVSVVLVSGTGPHAGEPLWKMGVAELPVDVRARQIRLSLHSDVARGRPGQKVAVTLHAAGPDGKPVQGEFSLAVVDSAVLSLAADNAPAILDQFYAERRLGVQTSYTQNIRGFQVSASTPGQSAGQREKHAAAAAGNIARKSGGGGGGGGAGVPATPRAYFPDTAYWNAKVTTDAHGDATIPVTLPDSLTTWRSAARGLTKDTLVGQTTLDLVSTRDLLLRPLLPRFFTLGDAARVGAVVNNTTDRPLTAQVTLTATGDGAPRALQPRIVTVGPNGERLVTWPLRPGALGALRLQLTASAAGVDGDNVLASAPVVPNSTPETVATSGQVGASRVEMVRVPAGAQPGEGGLTLTLQPSLAAGLRSSVDFLQHYPYESNEDLAARLMGEIALTGLPATATGLGGATLAAYRRDIAGTIARLVATQRGDGGWGWWDDDWQSDPAITAFVLDALDTARAAGYPVAGRAIAGGTSYVKTQSESAASSPLAVPTGVEAVAPDLQPYLSYLLAVSGDTSAGYSLFAARDSLPLWSRAYLLRALYLDNGSRLGPRGRTILAELEAGAHLDAAGAHWEESGDPLSGDDAIHATATVLDALVTVDPASPLIPQATRWLMAARDGEVWQTTVDNAVALRALSDELRASGDLGGRYAYTATLNNRAWGTGRVTPATLAAPRVLRSALGTPALPMGSTARVGVSRDNTSGRLYYTARLTYYPRVETVKPLARGVSIAREYLYNGRPVTAAPVGSTLTVRLTVRAAQDLYYLNVEDPFPAGGEAVDPTLLTTSQLQRGGYSAPKGTNDLAWYLSHSELRDDRAALFADYLPAGTYRYEYRIRLTTQGVFHALPARAAESYFPEVFGRSAGGYFTVR